MSIKTKDGKRVSDPATKNHSTEVRGIDISVILQRGRENGEKEFVILDKEAKNKVEKPIMNGVISTQLEYGMVFYTNEYKKQKAEEKASQSVSVNDELEIGE